MGEQRPERAARERTRAARILRIFRVLRRLDFWLYAGFAGVCTLAAARLFYGSMRAQLVTTGTGSSRMLAEWSAPLDDVFIHFDFARAISRGHPFEWSEGNGYSSGGTSLLYPFVLAIGYRLGFREQRLTSEPSLMLWAALLACVFVFSFLLASRRLFSGLPRATTYLAIPFLLGIGALDWTLFSGMEVAMFLAVWGGALIAWDDLTRPLSTASDAARPRAHESSAMRGAWTLGIWGAVLVLVRPEAVTPVAAFSLGAFLCVAPALGQTRALWVGALSLLPALAVVVLHSLANWVYTGDTAAAGALAKLEIYHPYLTLTDAFAAWRFHV